MIRVIAFLAAVLALATGLSWLADRPGNVTINWEGYVIETSVFRAVVLAGLAIGVSLILWSLIRHLWNSPAAFGNIINRRRQKKGLEALSAGMIAVGAGDRAGATRYAILARKALPNEPMTHLLRAQAAQLAGDKTTSRRIFESMLASPDTEPLGLRGLFLEAQRENETEAARQFAERALRHNPRLMWASDALFDIQCRSGDWAGALETLSSARKNGLIEKPLADRRRAVLLAAQAIGAEDTEPEKALNLAIEAHNLAPDLVPAAAQAGRMLAARGNTPRAAKILERTWSKSPHPDIATVYAYARVGDSPRDRLVRVKRLAEQNPYSVESAIAVANVAIDARAFDDARAALKPMLDEHLTQRIATLMARIESEQHGDKGRVREWLARAVNAPRDPVWTADGVVSDEWQPVSPVTGTIDAFQWKVPLESLTPRDQDVIARKVEELVALGAPSPINAVADDVVTVEAEPVTTRPARAQDVSPARPVAANASPADAVRGAAVEAAAVDVSPQAARKPASPAAAPAAALPAAREPAPMDDPEAARPTVRAAAPADRPAAAEAREQGPKPATATPMVEAGGEAARALRAKAADAAEAAGPGAPAKEAPVARVAAQRESTAPAPAAASSDAANAAKACTGGVAPTADTARASGGPKEPAKEPRIFVVPHAPDDPGPDGADTDPVPPKGTRPRYRALP